MVVLTAAVSAYNSGLYSNGRMLYALSLQHNAPKFLGKLNKSGAPFAGVLVSSVVTAVAVVLNFLFPGKVFLPILSVALIAGMINWAMVIITHIKFRKRLGEAEVAKIEFRMPFFPYGNYIVLAFLAGIVILMGLNPDFRYAIYVGPIWIAILFVSYRIKMSLERRKSVVS